MGTHPLWSSSQATFDGLFLLFLLCVECIPDRSRDIERKLGERLKADCLFRAASRTGNHPTPPRCGSATQDV